MNRRSLTVAVGAVPVVALLALGATVEVPFAAEGPGPVVDMLGEFDGKPAIQINGRTVYPAAGRLNVTTVSVRSRLSLFQAFGYWASGSTAIVPIEEVLPQNVSREQMEERNRQQFTQSESAAEIAARSYLGDPMNTVVDRITSGGPADGILRPGDVIEKVGGRGISSIDDVRARVREAEAGRPLAVTVRRDGRSETVQVTPQGGDDGPRIGITLTLSPVDDLDVRVNLAGIGGPSAGLMFAVTLVELLRDDDLAGGRDIAGTGAITATGQVQPIGGVTFKIRAARDQGATLFLVPAANCEEARLDVPDGIELMRVDSLSGAVDGLRASAAARDFPRC